MDILVEAHSGLRWLVLVALAATAVVSYLRMSRDADTHEQWLAWVAIVIDVQVTIGIVLYLFNQGWSQGGFIAVFHPIAMLAALGVFHAGISRGRLMGRAAGWRTIGIMTLIALVIILAAIPW